MKRTLLLFLFPLIVASCALHDFDAEGTVINSPENLAEEAQMQQAIEEEKEQKKKEVKEVANPITPLDAGDDLPFREPDLTSQLPSDDQVSGIGHVVDPADEINSSLSNPNTIRATDE